MGGRAGSAPSRGFRWRAWERSMGTCICPCWGGSLDLRGHDTEEHPMDIWGTGAAGFIGAALAARLLERGDAIFGIDNLNDYYDVGLKRARLARLTGHARFRFLRADIADRRAMEELFLGE